MEIVLDSGNREEQGQKPAPSEKSTSKECATRRPGVTAPSENPALKRIANTKARNHLDTGVPGTGALPAAVANTLAFGMMIHANK